MNEAMSHLRHRMYHHNQGCTNGQQNNVVTGHKRQDVLGYTFLKQKELFRQFSSRLAKGFASVKKILCFTRLNICNWPNIHTDSGTHRFLKTSIPFCILGADLPGNFPRDVSIINHGCHLQKWLLAVLRVLCIWCVPACRRLFALAELKLGKGDRPLIIRRRNRPDTPGNKRDH
ncbi:hypothetical protein T11_17955 [Trichinella zimbabwensis]|uniref:Uncharacterized protein n=1 Tax=Trichinella zimbabwensis TaxID=268475 RepID=A0A0V1H586_9BILA|nr:hypothetical protein T11_17955 [Trichinella zimbabwensis]